MLQVWPYLFGHYKWDFSSKDRRDMDRKNQSNYENKLSDWMAIDAIVRQRDKEITAANIAKLSGKHTKNVILKLALILLEYILSISNYLSTCDFRYI